MHTPQQSKRPSETFLSDGLFQTLHPLKKIIYKQAACRSDSRIRHLFAEQGTHIALAVGQTSDSRIRPARMILPNCFYFVRLFFRIGMKPFFRRHGFAHSSKPQLRLALPKQSVIIRTTHKGRLKPFFRRPFNDKQLLTRPPPCGTHPPPPANWPRRKFPAPDILSHGAAYWPWAQWRA